MTHKQLSRLSPDHLAELALIVRCDPTSHGSGRWKLNKQARRKVATIERVRRAKLMEVLRT